MARRFGYPISMLLNANAFDTKYTCVVCNNVLNAPMQFTCGHRLCEGCVGQCLKDNEHYCPACQNDDECCASARADSFTDYAARKEMKKLDVRCWSEECSWTGTLDTFETSHKDSCPFKPIVCVECGYGVQETTPPPPPIHPACIVSQLSKHGEAIGVVTREIPLIQSRLRTIEDAVETLRVAQSATSTEPNEQVANVLTVIAREVAGIKTGTGTVECEAIQRLNKTVGLAEVAMRDLQRQVDELKMTSYDGRLLWRINNFARIKEEAVSGKCTSIYSVPFHTSRKGYKMCVRLYPNGDGMGKNTHLSIFFVVSRGEFDALLQWPFRNKVTLRVLDQSPTAAHVSDSFRPDPTSSSFKKPTTDMNIASGCPLFMAHTSLVNYIKDNTIFVEVIVDTAL